MRDLDSVDFVVGVLFSVVGFVHLGSVVKGELVEPVDFDFVVVGFVEKFSAIELLVESEFAQMIVGVEVVVVVVVVEVVVDGFGQLVVLGFVLGCVASEVRW
jgi:hypothetical protein